jgi:adenylate cyclase
MFDSPEHVSLAVLLTVVRCHARMLVGDLRAALADNDYVLANSSQIEERDAHAQGYIPSIWTKSMRGRMLTMMGRYDEARPLLDELIASDETTVDAGHRIRAHLSMIHIAFALMIRCSQTIWLAARRLAHINRPRISRVSRVCTGLELSLRRDHRRAVACLGMFFGTLQSGFEGVSVILCHLAHAQLRAGLYDASRATAEEAANLASRYGNRVWLAFAEWLLSGPNSPVFRKLIKETDAKHLLRLRHPLH